MKLPKIVYKKPFIFPLLQLFFPDYTWNTKGIAITIGNTIYTDRFLTDSILAHEMLHVKQQHGSKLYAYFYYIPRYIIDRNFRERMENEAHAAEKETT